VTPLHWLKPLGLVAALLATSACEQAEPPATAPADDGMTGLQVSILNYTDEYIDEVYVNGSWAGNEMAHSGGGGFAGHASVPKQRDPNYTLTIEWRTESLYLKDPEAHYTREVATEPYQQDKDGRMAFLWVAFFPKGAIKLYPTWVAPGHPDFPEGLLAPSWECEKSFPGNPKCFAPKPRQEKPDAQDKEASTP